MAGVLALLFASTSARAQVLVRPLPPPPMDPTPRSLLDLLRDRDEGTKFLSPERDFAVVAAVHLRKVGTTEQLLGAVSPSDTILSTFPGLAVMGRVGFETGRVSVFGVFGAGAYRMIHWSVPASEAAMCAYPAPPDLWWSGAITGGLGAELRLAPWITFGAEYDVAQLTAQPGRGDLLWPNTADAVKTAIGAVRVAY